MAKTKVDNKLNVVIGTKAQVEADNTIPENSIIVVTDEELAPSDIPALPQSKITDLETDLNNKVDKIEGKGLSTEDYTTIEKNKLAGLTVGLNVNSWFTSTKTLALSDANKLFLCSHTADQTLTIPTDASVPFLIGTMITFLLTSTFTVTFSGSSGVTLTSMDSLVELATQYGMVSLIKTNANTWQLVGALE